MSRIFSAISHQIFPRPSFKSVSPIAKILYLYVQTLVAHTEMIFNDHGVSIVLKPGQCCITLRKLAEDLGLCPKKGKKQIENALEELKLKQLLGQEVMHTKNILSIIDQRDREVLLNIKKNTLGQDLGQEVMPTKDFLSVKDQRDKMVQLNIKKNTLGQDLGLKIHRDIQDIVVVNARMREEKKEKDMPDKVIGFRKKGSQDCYVNIQYSVLCMMLMRDGYKKEEIDLAIDVATENDPEFNFSGAIRSYITQIMDGTRLEKTKPTNLKEKKTNVRRKSTISELYRPKVVPIDANGPKLTPEEAQRVKEGWAQMLHARKQV